MPFCQNTLAFDEVNFCKLCRFFTSYVIFVEQKDEID